MPDLLTIVEQFRAAMERQDEAALKRLIDVYGRSYKRLDVLAQSLAERIADSAPTQAQVVRMMQYKALQEQMIEELMGIQAITRDMVAEQGALNVAMGERDAARMVGAALTGEPVILPGFNRLNPEAITALLGFLSPEGELYKRIGELAGSTADYVTEKMLEGITLGYNPRKIAQAFQDSYGRGLTDALRMVRTAQLYSYREANRASYTANSDVVEGWIWSATLDGLTCMGCVAMHGTFHTMDERLNGHHNCRCAMVPKVTIFPPAISETGEEWFSKQPEAVQRKMMGPGKYEAWKAGKFDLSQLSVERTDKVYGAMRGEAALKDLVGGSGQVKNYTLDLSGIKSYDDITKLFDSLSDDQQSVYMHGVTLDGMNKAVYRDVEIYFNGQTRRKAETVAADLELFKRNNGEVVFDKLFGNTKIGFTEQESSVKAVAGGRVKATGGAGKITVYGTTNDFSYEELIHEAGHTAGNKDYILDALRKFTAEGELSPTGYGRFNLDEDVAETIRAYFMDRDNLMFNYNNRYRLIRDFFNE